MGLVYFQIFKKSCHDEVDEEYFFGIDVQYLEKLHSLHKDLSFLSGRMKIKQVE